jgi:peptidoglycan/LPS O-acetylase OafA/YrhL
LRPAGDPDGSILGNRHNAGAARRPASGRPVRGVRSLAPSRLAFLDGVRGLAALYVVLHHAAVAVPPGELSGAGLAARFMLRHGHYAVAVFIVLSGYCLMRPVVHDPAGRVRGGFAAYLGRRARRIVPPYYAALVLCWVLIALVPALGHPPRTWWDRAVPAYGGGCAAAHLLLVHNLSVHWLFKVDPPAWSVATEWQIYLLFPLLLAVSRRWGIGAAVGAGFAVGYGVAGLSDPLGNPALRLCCPWYAGLFALGMAAAVVAGPRRRSMRCGRPAAAVGGLACLLAWLAMGRHDDRALLAGDPLVGLAAAALLVRWTRLAAQRAGAHRPPLLRLCEARASLALGGVSYSLYLVHYPLLALADAALRSWSWSGDARLAGHLWVTSPCCLAAAYLFHRAFERPFLGVAGPGVSRGPNRPFLSAARGPALECGTRAG